MWKDRYDLTDVQIAQLSEVVAGFNLISYLANSKMVSRYTYHTIREKGGAPCRRSGISDRRHLHLGRRLVGIPGTAQQTSVPPSFESHGDLPMFHSSQMQAYSGLWHLPHSLRSRGIRKFFGLVSASAFTWTTTV